MNEASPTLDLAPTPSEMEAINIRQFRALWWDLPSESLVHGRMRRLRCKHVAPNGSFAPCGEPLSNGWDGARVPCSCGGGREIDFSLARAVLVAELNAAGDEHATVWHCYRCHTKYRPTMEILRPWLERPVMCSKGHETGYTVGELARMEALAMFLQSWRARWFDRELEGWAHFDNFSVRIVPTDHAADVQKVLAAAVADFARIMPVLDTHGWFKAHHAADSAVWKHAIRFPEFVAEDVEAKRMVYDTVRNSMLAALDGLREGVLEALKEKGALGDRARDNLLARIAQMKQRDVWGLTSGDRKVREQLEALDGLLAGGGVAA